MSNPSQADSIAMFQAITGGDKVKAQQYLQFANWNLELAISNWFERGEEAFAEPVLPPPMLVQPPEEDVSVGVISGG